jgi:hypothetical protein
MERWDFDCQKCGGNIGDAWEVDAEWYRCKKDRDAEHRLPDHTPKGSGWGRLGYCFDVDCATELKFKCPVCGSELVKMVANQHPGGKWGIRGGRQPGKFRAW